MRGAEGNYFFWRALFKDLEVRSLQASNVVPFLSVTTTGTRTCRTLARIVGRLRLCRNRGRRFLLLWCLLAPSQRLEMPTSLRAPRFPGKHAVHSSRPLSKKDVAPRRLGSVAHKTNAPHSRSANHPLQHLGGTAIAAGGFCETGSAAKP